MSGDFDPRNRDSRDRDDGIHDRDEEWLTLGRGPASAAASNGAADDDVRDRNQDSPEARGRDSRDRDDERSGSNPRDVFMRDLDLPRGPERELVLHTTIQRIDEQRRQSGEAAKWEQELADLRKNLRQLPQNCHKLVKSAGPRKSENDVTARKSNRLGA